MALARLAFRRCDMSKPQLFYIGTSKAKEIRAGVVKELHWGTYGAWTSFKKPVADTAVKVTYDTTSKNAAGASGDGGAGGVTRLGSTIPAQKSAKVEGKATMCDVRYEVRGYTTYTRTSALKKAKQMLKTIYTIDNPYQYRIQVKDKLIIRSDYSQYMDGRDYIFFADHYFDDEGQRVNTAGHLPHPQTYEVTLSDVHRSFDTSNMNNSDGRDNAGTFVLSNVRANVATIRMTWQGLTAEEGIDLMDTLNPEKDKTGEYNYLIVQFLDPATGKATNKTFYASDRTATFYHDGTYKEISVTLTEV